MRCGGLLAPLAMPPRPAFGRAKPDPPYVAESVENRRRRYAYLTVPFMAKRAIRSTVAAL